jgi:hypothetical protein
VHRGSADGHAGLSNEFMKEMSSGPFQLAFSYLKVQPHGGFFVVHASSRTWYTAGLQPKQFLEMLGFGPTTTGCQKFGEDCFYKVTHELPPGSQLDFSWPRPADVAHASFDHLAANLGDLFERTRSIYSELAENVDMFPWAAQFTGGPRLLEADGLVGPSWIDEFKPAAHLEIERKIPELQEADRKYRQLEYVLWGTGEELEDAVQLLLTEMGVPCTKTVRGATVDLLGEVPSRGLKFAFEVTGTSDAIKKGSKKLSQALTYLMETSDEAEKIVVIANAHNRIPPKDRPAAFTPEIARLLKQNGITAVTTEQLYKEWLTNPEGPHEELFAHLHAHPGGVFESGFEQ